MCLYLHIFCLASFSTLQPSPLVTFHVENFRFHVGHVAMWYECMSLVIAAGLLQPFFLPCPGRWLGVGAILKNGIGRMMLVLSAVAFLPGKK